MEISSGEFYFIIFLFIHRSLPLLLPAVEDGIFNDNWRIRQSSVELLGDLLFKVYTTLLFCVYINIPINSPLKLIVSLSRLLELLGKLCLRVVVMMKVLAQKHMGVQLLRF